MSTESRFPAVMAEASKPNGSIPHAALAATALLEKTVRNDAGSPNPLEGELVMSVAVAPEPEVVRSSPSTTTAPAKELKTILRLCRAAAGMLGMLILLLVFARWVVIPIAFPVTNDAWPNANLTVITAPNEGNAQFRADVGQTIAQGDTVAVLSNSGVDPGRLARLKAEIAKAQAERTKHGCDLQTARELEQLAKQRLDEYRQMLIAELTASLDEADAKIKELTCKYQASRRVLDMYQRSGTAASRDERDRAAEAAAMARNSLEQAEASRKRLAIRKKAAEDNLFLERDAPLYLEQYLRVRQSIPQLETQLAQTDADLAAMAKELEAVEKHADQLAGGTISSPVSGVVVRRNTSWGPVAKGASLLEIAHTEGQFIEALFPVSHARSLYPGARAVIVFSGLPPFTGTVRAVRQPSPTDHEYTYAIRQTRRMNQLEVFIDFDQRPSDASLLGRQCQVLAADPSNPMHALASKLFCLLRW
jgi:multidrug resistance efflux pump